MYKVFVSPRKINGKWVRHKKLLASFMFMSDRDAFLTKYIRDQADWPVDRRWPLEARDPKPDKPRYPLAIWDGKSVAGGTFEIGE